VAAGTLGGMVATAWTLLRPLLGLAVVGIGVRDLARAPADPGR
jgi:hypothetical protein